MSEAVSETDLNAYVDDQLDIMRRLEVEDYLAHNPQLASRVIAELRVRDALKLVLHAPMRAPEAPTIEAAARLKKRMVWRSLVDKLRKVATIALFIGIGWFAHEEAAILHFDTGDTAAKAPIFVADAIIAHRTEQMRRKMETQSHQLTYDPAEIEARTNIEIPKLPSDWAVKDVQIFPSREGDSVEASIVVASLGPVSMFAAHVDSDQLHPPAVASNGAETTVYWQSGHEAVALTTNGSGASLQRAGWELFSNAMTTAQ